jgi:hypothetical protein
MASPSNRVLLNLTYVDRCEIAETFVDSMERCTFDGAAMRMEFVINRLDEPKPPHAPTGKKYTACRLVMMAAAVPHFVKQLNKMMVLLETNASAAQPGDSLPGKPN